ncbi:uncharacterized protein LOC102347843 [Latimeria chalumnae]|uniref:uncharacterized protein LOC102347843 n=1 Tax=Latimeria chalumnae TaxID=7897 RepID=UPI0003C145DE|nr:PREDICTED: uncharacterized protein LOC102347843 [Latimeria chalumnae]XP_014348207.1 PREDICTED: uncharacterized protein LOC102347843 [Latimeria chalumnae]XP_014348212.1 PREDICTED: uncharacterized protein LOC102347843 [Latimeria chalumnae]|eukprot:XP_005987766.1 PREDICTED: uncharacterized protein LOC102347843 [Latimeria chalumnae]
MHTTLEPLYSSSRSSSGSVSPFDSDQFTDWLDSEDDDTFQSDSSSEHCFVASSTPLDVYKSKDLAGDPSNMGTTLLPVQDQDMTSPLNRAGRSTDAVCESLCSSTLPHADSLSSQNCNLTQCSMARSALASQSWAYGGCNSLPLSKAANQATKRKKELDENEEVKRNEQIAESENLIFAQKCKELKDFIGPLTLLLNGLKSGRYRKGLNSFQESLAMDRIQRIIGVLQNPSIGAHYMNTLLQIEVLLKNWFPNVKPAMTTEENIPYKRQKLLDTSACCTEVMDIPKSYPVLDGSFLVPLSHHVEEISQFPRACAFSSTCLKWLHAYPICSLLMEQGKLGHAGGHENKDVMQDNLVSSSTDILRDPQSETFTVPPPCLKKLLKSADRVICHSSESSTVETSWVFKNSKVTPSVIVGTSTSNKSMGHAFRTGIHTERTTFSQKMDFAITFHLKQNCVSQIGQLFADESGKLQPNTKLSSDNGK